MTVTFIIGHKMKMLNNQDLDNQLEQNGFFKLNLFIQKEIEYILIFYKNDIEVRQRKLYESTFHTTCNFADFEIIK